mmetsp:Transcript_28840/g.82920  ORF Transcript_28840/g.82920 Transcript_28840/m.82920 type:complete len:272 (+) Transcript_28840:707-1522(+)
MLLLPSSMRSTSILEMHLRLWQSIVLQYLLSRRSSLSTFQHLPSPRAGVLMARRRTLVPLSHAFEHADQSDQSASSQSASQDCMLHETDSVVSPQGVPSYRTSTSTWRMRSMTPPLHSAEHPLQPLQIESSQSTGQGCSLHRLTARSGGQDMPPCGLETTFRVSIDVPPPQVAEHSSSCQSVTSQSWKKPELPCILYSSPRIFLRPHISLSKVRMFVLHSFLVSSMSFSRVWCSWPFKRPSSAAPFSPSVEVANFVCSPLCLISNCSISFS